MKKYRVTEDLQGGEFGMYRDYTLKEWRDQAIEWCEMDENYTTARALKRYEIKNRDLIAFIADYWQLEFAEV